MAEPTFGPSKEMLDQLSTKPTTGPSEEMLNQLSTEAPSMSTGPSEEMLNQLSGQSPETEQTFDALYQDQQLINTVRDFYFRRDGKEFVNDKQAINHFVSDRTWKQANLFSIGRELLDTLNFDEEEKQMIGFLQKKWEEVPNFWDEGGRGWVSGLISNVPKAVLDPINVIGVGVGGRLLGFGAKEVAKTIAKAAAIEGGIGTTAGGVASIITQETQKQIGTREEIDWKQVVKEAVTVGGISALTGAAVSGAVIGFRTGKQSKVLSNAAQRKVKKTSEIVEPKRKVDISTKREVKVTQPFSDRILNVRQEVFDRYNPVKKIQERQTGVGASVEGLKKQYLTPFDVDPVLLPYYQFRLLEASSTRADNFIVDHPIVPPDNAARWAEYVEQVDREGLTKILKPFADKGELEDFIMYASAKRALAIQSRGLETFFDADTSTKAAQERYLLFDLDPDYVQGLAKLKLYTDSLLDYQKRSDIISNEAVAKILNANPVYIPFYPVHTKQKGAPARQLVQGGTSDIIDPVESLISYTYKAIFASDRNRAKLSLYDMVNEINVDPGNPLIGQVARKYIEAEETPGTSLVTTKQLNQALQEQLTATEEAKTFGFDSADPSLDLTIASLTYSAPFEINGRFFDFAYRKGEREFYEIFDPELMMMLNSMGTHFNSFFVKLSKLSRLPAKFITYSPPFVGINFFRDTQSAATNSAFGFRFIPVLSSFKGLAIAIIDQEAYRRAMFNGLGFSSRTQNFTTNPLVNVPGLSDRPINKIRKKSAAYIYNNFISKGLAGYISLINKFEMAARMIEGRLASTQIGASPVGASYFGREVGTDFGIRGSNKFINLYSMNTMFFNAGLQGISRVIRRVGEAPWKVIAKVGAFVILPELISHGLLKGFDEYEQLPDEIKMMNYVFPDYEDWGKAWDYWSFQSDEKPKIKGLILATKPYDYAFYGNLLLAIWESIDKGNPSIGLDYVKDSFFNVVPSIAAPTLINPWISLFTNRDWRGNPLEPKRLQNFPKQDRYTENTPEAFKDFANWLADVNAHFSGQGKMGDSFISPIEMDTVVKMYLTGFMGAAVDIADSFLRDEAIKGKAPAIRSDQPPQTFEQLIQNPMQALKRRFNYDVTPLKYNKQTGELFDLIDRVKLLEGPTRKKALIEFERVLSLEKRLQTPEAQNLLALGNSKFGNNYLDVVLEKMGKIKVAQNVIQNNLELSPIEKRKQIDELQQFANDIAFHVMIALKNTRSLDSLFNTFFGETPKPISSTLKEDILSIRINK
jgi:hypothetical protein